MNEPKINLELQKKFKNEIIKIADQIAISKTDGLETFVKISLSLLHFDDIPFAESKKILIGLINACKIMEDLNEESN